jgi:hypothetical protein
MANSKESTALALVSSLAMFIVVPLILSVPPAQAAAPVAAGGDGEPSASLEVLKLARPQPVQDGALLTYTLQVLNTGGLTLTAAITDILPVQVTPSGHQTWTATIEPGGAWTQTLAVTVTEGYTGPLTNQVVVTTDEGASGAASLTTCANLCWAALPLILRDYPPELAPREWDPRLDELNVMLEPAPIQPGEPHWRLVAAQWADPSEAAGQHNIFFEVLDENEERAEGQSVVVDWADGQQTVLIKPGPPPEWGADFPMFATLGAYAASVGGGAPSDRVTGMGLGVPAFPDVKYHTSFYLTYHWIP